jgi:mevalonate kinase
MGKFGPFTNECCVFSHCLSYSFKSLKFLLTDSKVPREAKKLIAGVAQKKAEEPELVNAIISSVQSISDEARRALSDPELPRESLLSALRALIQENHVHLATLGVSHPALENIKDKTAADPYQLSTKLTGAGGGGCAVTLVPDGMSFRTSFSSLF